MTNKCQRQWHGLLYIQGEVIFEYSENNTCETGFVSYFSDYIIYIFHQ
jgi:hypothetical protein